MTNVALKVVFVFGILLLVFALVIPFFNGENMWVSIIIVGIAIPAVIAVWILLKGMSKPLKQTIVDDRSTDINSPK